MDYILDFFPVIANDIDIEYYANIERKIINKDFLTQKEIKDFLDVLIYIVRYKINPNLDNYDNKCDLAVSMLYHYLNNLNCEVLSHTTQNTITDSIIGHSFLILRISVEGKKQDFLLDPTYIQFFRKEKCKKNNYYISPSYKDYILLTPDPGYFIKNDMKENAEFILNHGYIKLDEDSAMMYGDSFYNTKTGINYNNMNYQTIPGSVYINSFLKSGESVSKTEDELKNLNLNIEYFESQKSTLKKR